MNDREEMRHVAIAKYDIVVLCDLFSVDNVSLHLSFFRENSPAGKRYNRLTFELIRRWLDEKSSQKHKLMDEVQSYCNGTLKTYFGQDVTVDLPRLKVDSEQPSQPAPSTSGNSPLSFTSSTHHRQAFLQSPIIRKVALLQGHRN